MSNHKKPISFNYLDYRNKIMASYGDKYVVKKDSVVSDENRKLREKIKKLEQVAEKQSDDIRKYKSMYSSLVSDTKKKREIR